MLTPAIFGSDSTSVKNFHPHLPPPQKKKKEKSPLKPVSTTASSLPSLPSLCLSQPFGFGLALRAWNVQAGCKQCEKVTLWKMEEEKKNSTEFLHCNPINQFICLRKRWKTKVHSCPCLQKNVGSLPPTLCHPVMVTHNRHGHPSPRC